MLWVDRLSRWATSRRLAELSVAGLEQLAVFLAQLLHADRQPGAPFLELLVLERLVGFHERQIQLVAEVEPLSAAGPQKIEDLVTRHSACPVDEALAVVELLELVPQDEAGLLKQVIGIVQVADQ